MEFMISGCITKASFCKLLLLLRIMFQVTFFFFSGQLKALLVLQSLLETYRHGNEI